MGTEDELCLKPVTQIVSELREGKIRTEELTNYLVGKVDRVDRRVHAYTVLNTLLLATLREGKPPLHGASSPLYGLPVAVKDLIDTKGIETCYGSEIFAGHIPTRDASVVTRIKKSGGFIFGKTVTHEFALGLVSHPTKNPWDTQRIPGGSSGGSAAAVAAGEALFALGSDTGGSIRIPASMCGVTGLKPTYGRIPCNGVFPEAWSLDHLGPITRYAKDLPLELASMGYDITRRVQEAKHKKKLRAAVIQSFLDQSDGPVRSTVNAAISKLISEGIVEIEDIPEPPFDEMLNTHAVIDTSEIAVVHTHIYKIYPEHKKQYLEDSVTQIEQGLHNPATAYIEALKARRKHRKTLSNIFKRVDVLLSPTLPRTAPLTTELKAEYTSTASIFVAFLAPFNLTGNPAITVPCGFAIGLPVGLQIVSDYARDEIAIILADRFQNITEWHTRLPPLPR